MSIVSVKCRFCGLTAPVKIHGTGNGGSPRFRLLPHLSARLYLQSLSARYQRLGD